MKKRLPGRWGTGGGIPSKGRPGLSGAQSSPGAAPTVQGDGQLQPPEPAQKPR